MKKREHFIFLFLCSILWVYLWFRAIYVPLVHDEIATFYYNVQTGRFLPFYSHWDMNNHVVNSGLSTIFYHLFGFSPLVLRLANLISFSLFCLFLWKLGGLFANRSVRWWIFLCLLFTQGFIEFFSLSRGYGMSMTFLLGLFYSLYQVTDKFSIKGVFITLLWALIATISNLALINIWLIVICWLLLLLILKKENYPFRKRIIPFLLVIVISLFSTVFFAVISFKARELGLLYTGGAEGFDAVTLKSLLLIFIGVDFSEAHYILGFYFILLLEYTVYKVCIQHVFFQRTVLSFIFLAGNLIAYWLLHGIFGVNYPENRVVVYLLPVFLIALGFSLDDLMAMTGKRIFLFLLLPFLILPAIFPLKINFTTTESYFKDPVSVEFYNKIANEQLSGDYPPTVGGHRLYLLCWSYLDYINNGTQSALSWQDYPGKIADFQIIDKKELPLFHNDYRVVGEYNESSRYLMKRVHPIKKQLIVGQKGIHTEDETNFEYFNLFIANVDSLVGRSLYIGFKGKIQSIMVPFEAWIVADVKDAAGNSMRYVNYGLNWHKNSWQGGSSYIKNGLILHDLPSGSVTLVLYLWNINKAPFRIENFECTLFRYSE